MGKNLTLLIAAFVISICTSAEAYTIHRLSMASSNIEITAYQPEELTELEREPMDLCFQHSEDMSRQLAFYYFPKVESGFDFASQENVADYHNWLIDEYFVMDFVNQTLVTQCGSDFCTQSLTLTDSNGTKTYGFIYSDTIDNELIFSIIATSAISMEEAKTDCANFVNNDIFWLRKE